VINETKSDQGTTKSICSKNTRLRVFSVLDCCRANSSSARDICIIGGPIRDCDEIISSQRKLMVGFADFPQTSPCRTYADLIADTLDFKRYIHTRIGEGRRNTYCLRIPMSECFGCLHQQFSVGGMYAVLYQQAEHSAVKGRAHGLDMTMFLL